MASELRGPLPARSVKRGTSMASRSRQFAGRCSAISPGYLAGASGAGDIWVGAPLHDPQESTRWVVPIAARVRTGPTSTGWAGALLSFAGLEQLNRRFGDQVSELALLGLDGTVLANVGKGKLDLYTGRNVSGA